MKKAAKSFLIFSLLALLWFFVQSFTSSMVYEGEFVYGLPTKAAEPVEYLPERESRRLPIQENVVAYYSQERAFGLGEILQIAGVPLYRCNSPEEANGSKILVLDLEIDRPKTFSAETMEFLKEYVRNGGVLIGTGIFSYPRGDLKKIFGYKSYRPTREHTVFILEDMDFFGKYLNRDEERNYRLAARKGVIATNEIVTETAKTIGRYEDGTTAIALNRYGKGVAVSLGLSLYDMRYRNLVGRDAQANEKYINGFEPLSDFFPLFLRGLYENIQKKGLLLSTAPGSAKATVVLTHDVDFVRSVPNMDRFVALEKEKNVTATYTIWVKYLRDYKDLPFFIPQEIQRVVKAENEGFDIGSHTVEHTANFDRLPFGNCRESYPQYRPVALSRKKDGGEPTLCGEVKVSKELLLGAGVKEVVSFRSGELLYHPRLPEVLERFGYRYSSCFSAEDVMSYFPYRYYRDFYPLKEPSKIWEIPLAYEDEEFPPLIFRLGKAKELLKKISENGGVFTILIHPDLTLWRLKNLDLLFLKKFLEEIGPDIAVKNMKEFGDFWDLRDRLVWRYIWNREALEIEGWSPAKGSVSMKPFGWQFSQIPKQGKGYRIENGILILDVKKGSNRWAIPFE